MKTYVIHMGGQTSGIGGSEPPEYAEFKKYIDLNTKVRFGRPCIKGTRISVYDVLNWLSAGQSVEKIINDFPELNKTKVRACLAYAADKEGRTRVA